MSQKTSAVTGNAIQLEVLQQKETIRLKKNVNVIKQFANTKYAPALSQMGDEIKVQQVPYMKGSIGGVAGGDIVPNAFVINSFNLKIDHVYQNSVELTKIEMKQSDLDLAAQTAQAMFYDNAVNEDKFVASFVTDAYASNKAGNLSPVTLTTSNVFTTFRNLQTRLQKVNAYRKNMPLLVNADILEIMEQSNRLDGTTTGADIALNGYSGKFAGFRTIETNHLPHVVALTMDTNPTANDTITLTVQDRDGADKNVTFKFVASASAAGDITIGANVSATQTNLINAINGSGTGFVDLSATNRTYLKNFGVQMKGDFVSNKINVQSFDTLGTAETFTAATNVFGVDAVIPFVVDNNAINYVSQLEDFFTRPAPKGNRTANFVEKVYGGAVLGENAKGIATVEVVAV